MKFPHRLALRTGRQRFLLFAALYLLLWLGAWESARVLGGPGGVSLWFLPAGLRFFCLLALGWRGVLLELAVQVVFALLQITSLAGEPITDFLSTNTLWRLFNLLGPLAAYAAVTLPLRRWMRDSWDFTQASHTIVFLLAALAASTLAALAGVFGILKLGLIDAAQIPSAFPSWLIGDFVAIITLSPLLLVRVGPCLRHYLQSGHWRHRHAASSAAADRNTAQICALSLLLLFGMAWSINLHANVPLICLLLLLPLAAVALRHGLRGAVLAVLLLDGALVLLIALFAQHDHAVNYQVVMIAIAFVGLWLGGLVDARARLIVRYRDFASVANDLLWETDDQGRLLETRGRLAHRIDLAAGQSWRTVLTDDSPPALAILNGALAQRALFRHQEIAVRGVHGEVLWIELNGLPLRDEAGVFIGYRGTAVDVTRSRQAEALLRNYNEDLLAQVAERTIALRRSHADLEAKERHLEVLLAAVPVGIIEIDGNARCRYINVNGCALTGYTPEEAQGRAFLDFVHPDERAYVDFIWKINDHSAEVHWLEFRINRTGVRCSAHWILQPHADPAADGAIIVLTNTTARSKQDQRLWTLAHHDALTELPNRNLFWDRARQALLHAKRNERGAALLLIDLDGFKAVNDRLGHAAGDALLQQVAQRLKQRIRQSDTVARIGGDEFAVIMPDIAIARDALQPADELLASLAQPFNLPQGTVQISGSIGVALYPYHAQTAETLMQCADLAMYAAKNSGRNRTRLWNDG